MSFELIKNDHGEFHFNFLDEDDKMLIKSEQYSSKAAAQNGIDSVRKNATDNNRYELKEAKSGQVYFNLKAGNGQVIGTSRMFADNNARLKAMAYLKDHAVQAGVLEDI